MPPRQERVRAGNMGKVPAPATFGHSGTFLDPKPMPDPAKCKCSLPALAKSGTSFFCPAACGFPTPVKSPVAKFEQGCGWASPPFSDAISLALADKASD